MLMRPFNFVPLYSSSPSPAKFALLSSSPHQACCGLLTLHYLSFLGLKYSSGLLSHHLLQRHAFALSQGDVPTLPLGLHPASLPYSLAQCYIHPKTFLVKPINSWASDSLCTIPARIKVRLPSLHGQHLPHTRPVEAVTEWHWCCLCPVLTFRSF